MSWTKATAPSTGTPTYRLLLALTSEAPLWTAASVSSVDLWTKATAPSTSGTPAQRLTLAFSTSTDPWTKRAAAES